MKAFYIGGRFKGEVFGAEAFFLFFYEWSFWNEIFLENEFVLD